jgi:hypothetical protein
MVMGLIQSTVSGLKTAGDIAQSMLELKTLSEVQGKVIDLQRAILSAQSSALSANADQFAMVEKISTLKKEIADIKAWESEKERYKLVSPWEGAIAYAVKKSMCNSEPPHWICTKCYEDGRKSILNPDKNPKGFSLFACPVCSSKMLYQYMDVPDPEYAPE